MPVLSTLGAAIANVYGFTSGLIKDQYFNLVSLLLPGNGTNGAQNNTFLDSGTANSGSGFTITRNGNTTQGTFSPFSQTGWGNYFDGSNDNVSASSSTDLAAGSGAFTIEAWVFTADTKFMICASQTVGGLGFGYNIDNGTQGLWLGRVGTGVDATSGVQLTYNQWNHVAVTRDGSNNVKFFVNGTQSGSTATVTTNYGTTAQGLYLGADQDGASNAYVGYLSNFRYIKGQSILGTATSFTVPTSPLTSTAVGWSGTGVASSITGTVSLLTCQSNRFVDNSTTPKTLTPNNGAAITPFSPFAPAQSYSAAAVGGSGYFDGTGDYVQAASNAAFAIGTGDFAIECFVYFTGTAQGGGTSGELFGSTTTGSIVLRYKSGTLALSRVNTADDMSASVTLTPNQWYHICATRTGTTGALYLNGTRVGTASSYTVSYAQGDIGTINNTQGYLTCCRLIKAANPYGTDTTITVPTAPLTAVSGTSLLLNFTNAGVVDATAKNVLETVGNAQISTTQSKWGGGSMYFDGTGDYLLNNNAVSDLLAFGSGDFTIEMWVRFASITTGVYTLYDARPSGTQGAYASIALDQSTAKIYYYVSSAIRITATNTVSANTWYHIALCRSGTSTKLFINGTQEGSTWTDTTTYLNPSARPSIGASGASLGSEALNGFVDDLRVTKGYARYTSNFTAPTAPFPVQ